MFEISNYNTASQNLNEIEVATIWENLPSRALSMREMKTIIRSPQGTRHTPGYANEGTHRSALHNESISQALAKQWVRERLQERCDTPASSAMMILDLTVLSFAKLMELHIALSAQQQYDFAEEQTVGRALQEWITVYVRDCGDQVSLLETAVGVKRPRVDGEGMWKWWLMTSQRTTGWA